MFASELFFFGVTAAVSERPLGGKEASAIARSEDRCRAPPPSAPGGARRVGAGTSPPCRNVPALRSPGQAGWGRRSFGPPLQGPRREQTTASPASPSDGWHPERDWLQPLPCCACPARFRADAPMRARVHRHASAPLLTHARTACVAGIGRQDGYVLVPCDGHQEVL